MIKNKLLTVLTEIETIVNNHSLTQGSDNCEDKQRQHFQTNTSHTQGEKPREGEKRWINKYLLVLQNLKKLQTTKKNLKLGASVLLKEDVMIESKQPLAMVVKMFPSSDSHLKLDVKVNVCGNGKNFDGNLHEANYKNLFLKMR